MPTPSYFSLMKAKNAKLFTAFTAKNTYNNNNNKVLTHMHGLQLKTDSCVHVNQITIRSICLPQHQKLSHRPI